jgi:hypothetical protein
MKKKVMTAGGARQIASMKVGANAAEAAALREFDQIDGASNMAKNALAGVILELGAQRFASVKLGANAAVVAALREFLAQGESS